MKYKNVSKMTKQEKKECYGNDTLPIDGYNRYNEVTRKNGAYPVADKVLCDPYSTKYLPKGGNCDPLNVTSNSVAQRNSVSKDPVRNKGLPNSNKDKY